MNTLPSDFARLETKSPFISHVGPLYIKHVEDQAVIGLLIEKVHCNTGGRLHGAMVCAIADIALGQNVARAFHKRGAFENSDGSPANGTSMVTVSLSTDFAGTASIGDWVEAHADVQRASKRTAFANTYLIHRGERIARVSGVYQLITISAHQSN